MLQVEHLMMRLKSDLVKILLNTIENKLNKTSIIWSKKKCMTIVLCSKGYPGKYQKEKQIKNLDKLKLNKNNYIFHAGTKYKDDKIVSNGGRVLNITSTGSNFKNIRQGIIKIIKKIKWKYGFFRRDIGWKVITK